MPHRQAACDSDWPCSGAGPPAYAHSGKAPQARRVGQTQYPGHDRPSAQQIGYIAGLMRRRQLVPPIAALQSKVLASRWLDGQRVQ